MSVLYLDSSAFIKLYTDENPAHTQLVEEALGLIADVASSAITHAEVCGVFGRQFQDNRLSERDYRETRRAFETDWQSVDVLGVSAGVSKLAADLLKAHKTLHAMDALHLASALALRQYTPIKFLTFDKRLEEVAGKLMPEAT